LGAGSFSLSKRAFNTLLHESMHILRDLKNALLDLKIYKEQAVKVSKLLINL